MTRSPQPAPSRSIPLVRCAIALALGVVACTQGQGADAPTASKAAAVTMPVEAASTTAGKLDVLFMIDDSSSMLGEQGKLYEQIPLFVNGLKNLPLGLPDVHIAVVSSDMGAPGDSTASEGCTSSGDQGVFQLGSTSGMSPSRAGTGGTPGSDGGDVQGIPGGDGGLPTVCASAGLTEDQRFLSNIGGVTNYTGDLGTVLQCMVMLDEHGCGFEQQLGSVARALGADGAPAPAANAGFLRPDAELAIIFLSNEDDCSAPADTRLFSLNAGGSDQQNASNALGPIANYRCNQFGHLCVDPASGPACLAAPPLQVPADAQGTVYAPTLNLTECESADMTGLLTSVSGFVKGIKSLKADPDKQIVVGAIVGPTAPYTVAWVPANFGGQNLAPGELWPEVEHSCGVIGLDDVNPAAQASSPGDGSFGDPAVRLTQFVNAFGANGVTASVCDPSYATTVENIVTKIGAQLPGGAGTSGTSGTSGTDPSLTVCPAGVSPDGHEDSGLQRGNGCDIGAARPGGIAVSLVFALLLLGLRRRASSR